MSECRGKRRFDRLGAMLALAEAKAHDRDEKRIYRCPRCGGWHLTSWASAALDVEGLRWLVDQAIRAGIISQGRGAELLGISLREMRALGLAFANSRTERIEVGPA